jgi:formate dehydrogenase maturation protein FdhE
VPTPSTCPSCSSPDLLVVHLAPKGEPMRFSTCRHCEHRWWEQVHVGAGIELRTVLTHLAAA